MGKYLRTRYPSTWPRLISIVLPRFDAGPLYFEGVDSLGFSMYDFHLARHDRTIKHGPFEAASDLECLALSRLVLFDLGLTSK